MVSVTSVVIRHACADDAEGVAAILNSIIAAGVYTALDTPVTVGEERAFISRFPERGIFLVAVDSATGEIVGFQNVSPFADYTHAFDHVGVIGTYVALDRHRQGIAAKLFEATGDAAHAKKYEKLFGFVRADNDAGLRTYLGQGFRIIGTAACHAKIGGEYIDEVLIEKWLMPSRAAR